MSKCKQQCGLFLENQNPLMKHLRNSMLKLFLTRSRSRILSSSAESISKWAPLVFRNWMMTFNQPMNKWRQTLSSLTLLNRICSLKMIFIIKYQGNQSCTQKWISTNPIRSRLSIRKVLDILNQERINVLNVLVLLIKFLIHQVLKEFAGYVLEKRKMMRIMNSSIPVSVLALCDTFMFTAWENGWMARS